MRPILTPLHFKLDWCFIVCPPLIVLYTVNRYAPLNPLYFLRSMGRFLYVGFYDFRFSGQCVEYGVEVLVRYGDCFLRPYCCFTL